jgi:hypothetical protein
MFTFNQYLFLLSLICLSFQKSDVYYTSEISPKAVLNLFEKLRVELKGKIGLKVHTGETGGKYFLRPEFLKEIYDATGGTFIECNTAYKGARHTTELHEELLKAHNWSQYDIEILDAYGEKEGTDNPDKELTIKDPVKISKNYVGGKIDNYESSIVLSHVKGHEMGGFGGALKQLSIGFASQRGKAYIHTAGNTTDWTKAFECNTSQEDFTASMGDAAASVVEYFRAKGGIAFISVIANISLKCDCAGGSAPEPKIHDIGILASTDPVAIDRAALDIIKARLEVPGTQELLKQIADLKGENIITVAEKHKIGTTKYNLINVDQPNVFFTREISPDSVVKMFKHLNYPLGGKVGLKVHTGEKGGKYFLRPEFLQKIYDYTQGTFIECNTAYELVEGYSRANTTEHKKLLEYHGWSKNGRRVVIMDENPENDEKITVDNPAKIKTNIVGEHLFEFESCLVLAHFKGHGAGGFGGSLKQLSIGFASQAGKANIHTAGVTTKWQDMFTYWASQENFTSSMGDAASTIVKYFRGKKGIAFINVLANISLYCDCSGDGAPEPRIKDIGILASTDPVAIDQASLDMLRTYTDEGTFQLLEQIKFLKGENTIHIAEQHGIGKREYNFIDVDEHDDEPTDSDSDSDKGSDDPKENDSEKKSLYIVIGVLAAVGVALIIALIVVCCVRKKKLDTNVGSVSLVTKEE